MQKPNVEQCQKVREGHFPTFVCILWFCDLPFRPFICIFWCMVLFCFCCMLCVCSRPWPVWADADTNGRWAKCLLGPSRQGEIRASPRGRGCVSKSDGTPAKTGAGAYLHEFVSRLGRCRNTVVALWEAFYFEGKCFDLDTLRVPNQSPTPSK